MISPDQPRGPEAVVVDASVALKLLLLEEESLAVHQQWDRWVAQDVEIVGPFLLAYEVLSVLRGKVFRGDLPREAGEAATAAFLGQGIALLHPEGVEQKAWELATGLNLPTVYDAAYLALAEILECELWTADRRLGAAVRRKTRRVRLIGG